MTLSLTRCPWVTHSEDIRYHDEEWGVPCFDDRKFFEFIVLEAAQAGLSWITILRKREGYRRCFAEFDPLRVAAFSEKHCEELMLDSSIVRNRKKIESAVTNARLFLELQMTHGSFSNFIWSYTEGKAIQGNRKKLEDIPAVTPLAEKISKDLKKIGFKFLGPTVVYAYMQAMGLVNDHTVSCFRHNVIQQIARERGLL